MILENTDMIPKHNQKHFEGVIRVSIYLSWPAMAGATMHSEAFKITIRFQLTANYPKAAICRASGRNGGNVENLSVVETELLNKLKSTATNVIIVSLIPDKNRR
jgi:hypothetical protein